VAIHILVREVYLAMVDRFHEMRMPPPPFG
jgi:hypothetical protein